MTAYEVMACVAFVWAVLHMAVSAIRLGLFLRKANRQPRRGERQDLYEITPGTKTQPQVEILDDGTQRVSFGPAGGEGRTFITDKALRQLEKEKEK